MMKMGLMRKMALSIFASAVVLYADVVTPPEHKALTLTEQQEESLVKSIIPSTKVEKIVRAEVDGFYKAYLGNGQILYINPFKRLIFVGEIFTTGGQNLTVNDRVKWQSELQNKQLTTLNKAELIKDAKKVDFKKGANKYEFVVFTDPECPYCKKAEDHFEKYDTSVYINFLPLPFHKNAEKWSLEALSSKDFKKAIKQIKTTGKDLGIDITPKAREQLEKMKALGQELGITGTPKFFVIEKNSDKVVDIIDGANIPKIDEYLKKDKNDDKK